MNELFKLVSIGFIVFLITILSYKIFIYYLPPTLELDNSRMHRVLEEQKIKFGNYTYYELLGLMRGKKNKTHNYTIEKYGITYKLQVSSYWLNEYQKSGDLIVFFAIYTGFITSQNSLRSTIIKSKPQ